MDPYVWKGITPPPTHDQMNAGIAVYREVRGKSQLQAMHLMALLFAREANVEPDLKEWPQLARALLFGPLSAISFRLSGPDHLPHAKERIAAEAQALGTIVNSTFSSEEVAQLHALAAVRKDPNFAEFVDRIANFS